MVQNDNLSNDGNNKKDNNAWEYFKDKVDTNNDSNFASNVEPEKYGKEISKNDKQIPFYKWMLGLFVIAITSISFLLYNRDKEESYITSEVQESNIDNTLRQLAILFQNKLQFYEGELKELHFKNNIITAKWSSKKTDYFDAEIIDFAICLNREFKKSFSSIEITRTCSNNENKFSISSRKYKLYITGEISDSQFTEGYDG